MKRVCQQITYSILGALICVSLSGCTVGGYRVFDTYVDENGEQHFMGFGETGSNGGESIVNENSTEEVDDVQGNGNWAEEVDDVRENETNYNSESIVGTSLKKGWTSSDNSILKGRGVLVKEDSTLFSIELGQDKEVTISYDIALDDGEYQLVYINSDGTVQILQDRKLIQSEEQILFTQGQNTIAILSNNAIFKEIDIRIIGIEVSDFEAGTENTIGNGLQEMGNSIVNIQHSFS